MSSTIGAASPAICPSTGEWVGEGGGRGREGRGGERGGRGRGEEEGKGGGGGMGREGGGKERDGEEEGGERGAKGPSVLRTCLAVWTTACMQNLFPYALVPSTSR